MAAEPNEVISTAQASNKGALGRAVHAAVRRFIGGLVASRTTGGSAPFVTSAFAMPLAERTSIYVETGPAALTLEGAAVPIFDSDGALDEVATTWVTVDALTAATAYNLVSAFPFFRVRNGTDVVIRAYVWSLL